MQYTVTDEHLRNFELLLGVEATQWHRKRAWAVNCSRQTSIEHDLVADKWGQHKWGHCKSNGFWQIGEKGTPWHFWGDESRLMGVTERSLSTKIWNVQWPPISADPICPFPIDACCKQLIGPATLTTAPFPVRLVDTLPYQPDRYHNMYIYIYIYIDTILYYNTIYLSLYIYIYIYT